MPSDPAPVSRPCYACRGVGSGGEGRRCLWCDGTGVDPNSRLTGGTDGNANDWRSWGWR